MKLYFWKHKGRANRPENFYPLSKCESGPSWIRPIAVHGFFTLTEAVKHLEEIGWDKETMLLYELISAEV